MDISSDTFRTGQVTGQVIKSAISGNTQSAEESGTSDPADQFPSIPVDCQVSGSTGPEDVLSEVIRDIGSQFHDTASRMGKISAQAQESWTRIADYISSGLERSGMEVISKGISGSVGAALGQLGVTYNRIRAEETIVGSAGSEKPDIHSQMEKMKRIDSDKDVGSLLVGKMVDYGTPDEKKLGESIKRTLESFLQYNRSSTYIDKMKNSMVKATLEDLANESTSVVMPQSFARIGRQAMDGVSDPVDKRIIALSCLEEIEKGGTGSESVTASVSVSIIRYLKEKCFDQDKLQALAGLSELALDYISNGSIPQSSPGEACAAFIDYLEQNNSVFQSTFADRIDPLFGNTIRECSLKTVRDKGTSKQSIVAGSVWDMQYKLTSGNGEIFSAIAAADTSGKTIGNTLSSIVLPSLSPDARDGSGVESVQVSDFQKMQLNSSILKTTLDTVGSRGTTLEKRIEKIFTPIFGRPGSTLKDADDMRILVEAGKPVLEFFASGSMEKEKNSFECFNVLKSYCENASYSQDTEEKVKKFIQDIDDYIMHEELTLQRLRGGTADVLPVKTENDKSIEIDGVSLTKRKSKFR